MTQNSALLAGYIIGAMHGIKHPFFHVVDCDPEAAEIIVEVVDDDPQPNRFRVCVEQIGGAE